MNSLGVEFYRNYVGIEKPLKVKCLCVDRLLFAVSNSEIESNTNFFYKYEECKPYLKTVEDLTDEELLFVFCGDNRGLGWSIDRIEGEEIILQYVYERWNSFSVLDFVFDHCDQELLNRLYSLHSHPKAKQLIEKGLALSYKDLL